MKKVAYTELTYEDSIENYSGRQTGPAQFQVSRTIRENVPSVTCSLKMFVGTHVLVNPTCSRAGVERLRDMLNQVLEDWKL